jgi:alpha-mannosidase
MYLTLEKLDRYIKDVQKLIHPQVIEIDNFKYHEGDVKGAEKIEFDDSSWKDFTVGTRWGGYDKIAWFRKVITIPEEMKDKPLSLRFSVGPRDGGGSTTETLLYLNGEAVHGLTIWHEEVRLSEAFKRNANVQVAMRAWSGVMNVPQKRRFAAAQLLTVDLTTEKFYYLAKVLYESAKELDEKDYNRVEILKLLDEAFDKVDFLKPKSEEFYNSIKTAYEFLKTAVDSMKSNSKNKPTIAVSGHSHIDVAWLWRLRHSREKASRTFSSMLHLMDRFPEFKYLQSTPQLYEYIREDHPEIFEKVKERIKEGRWEITGAMWVEADTNMPNGESLVRQILYGKRYMKNEFGVDSTVLWLPDVFGYSWALPQILKKSKVEYFMTTKMSWNQYNKFPYDTFKWRGIDGSEIITQLGTSPEEGAGKWQNTYNASLRPWDIKGTWDRYEQKEINNEVFMPFGWGDGGGGPTKEMIEAYYGMEDLPGMPKVKMKSLEEFFAGLDERLKNKNVPVWDGEMYLEYHRGTYTSQAFIKRANRKAEILFHELELLGALADILNNESLYEQKVINKAWEKILLNQFHDIIPGSSIKEVYEDAREDYKEINETGYALLNEAVERINKNINVIKDSIVVFNTLSWNRNGIIELPWNDKLEGKSLIVNGKALLSQIVGDNEDKKMIVAVEGIPSLGYRAIELSEKQIYNYEKIAVKTNYLENRYYKIKLNQQGHIESLHDKINDREVLAEGQKGNVLQAFEDKPFNFDAWNIEIYYQQKMKEINNLIESVVEESGPVRGVLRLKWRLEESTITQRVIIYNNSPRIDFKTEVDWKERQVLLKAAFPVDIRSTKATYDIQFGNVERATHWNTSWDYAKFESVAHKWVDLSEGNYGVSLLNDCKYGHDIKDNVMRITLIKSPIEPDLTADIGLHYFTYSLLPHNGTWKEANIVREAYDLNSPMFAYFKNGEEKDCLNVNYSFAGLNVDNAMIETVKKAEDENAWIVRIYEYKNYRKQNVELSFTNTIAKAVECNLMEQEDTSVNFTDNKINFKLSPYEIKTFKVWFK